MNETMKTNAIITTPAIPPIAAIDSSNELGAPLKDQSYMYMYMLVINLPKTI